MNIKKLILSIIISSVIIVITTGAIHFGHTLDTIIGGSLTFLIEVFSLFLLALAPIMYGLITRDKIGSVIVGVLPVVGLFLYFYSSSIISREFISMEILTYFGILVILGGLEGYFASIKEIQYNILAICCFLFWVVFFIRGFVD
ncbi:hypothetical protein [Methanococcoides seepicolus]|uniref:Uncharacterized protein n=1 Tax=Methanococcoides seepicolus TaxID=2828780 RepID=A0A9E4ZEA2_9EURY|nr:hypothetical protein [Methanococcoides seepicolus]MCM1986310.1 hypothetical protein [Methanococcoides seepicolus]